MLFKKGLPLSAFTFLFCSNAFPDFGSVGRKRKKKQKKKWRSLELGSLVPQHNNMRSLEMTRCGLTQT